MMNTVKPKTTRKVSKQPPIWYADETDWGEIANILWEKMELAELKTFMNEFEDSQDFCLFLRTYIPETQILQCMHSEFAQGTIVGIAWKCMQEHFAQLKEQEEDDLNEAQEG